MLAWAIVAVCTYRFPDFFFIDDAQNEHLPFFTEMGRLWLAGELPLLTTRTFEGGNIHADMVLSPFAPQTILTSLVAALSEGHRIPTLFFAWLNLTLVICGGAWLASTYQLGARWGLLVGFLFATQPTFLFVYCASWWNTASAFAWFVIGFAALRHLQASPSVPRLLLAVAAACFVFLAAGTHMQIAYGLTWLALCATDRWANERRAGSFCLWLVLPVALLLAALPVMSEYLAVSHLTTREVSVHNRRNLLVPHWGMLLNFFNPLYFSHFSWFNGYRYMPVSWAYTTAVGLVALLMFTAPRRMTRDDAVLVALGSVVLLLCFMPSQWGPLRWPFRMLPVLAIFLTVFCIRRVALGTWRPDLRRASTVFGISVAASLIGWFSSRESLLEVDALMRAQLTLFLLGGACVTAAFVGQRANVEKAWWVWASCVSGLAFVLAVEFTGSLASNGFPHFRLPEHKQAVRVDAPGYVLSLCPDGFSATASHPSDLSSAQLLLYGMRSVNGYTPVGHRVISPYFAAPRRELLHRLTLEVPGYEGLRAYEAFRISRIYVCKTDLDEDLSTRLAGAGLQAHALDQRRVEFAASTRDEGSLSGVSGRAAVRFVHAKGERQEVFRVTPGDADATTQLIFSRVFWPGYSASLDGQALPVRMHPTGLVAVDLPRAARGVLTLSYAPVSSRVAAASFASGLVLLSLSLFWLARTRARAARRAAATPEITAVG